MNIKKKWPPDTEDPIIKMIMANKLASDRQQMLSGLSQQEYADIVENKPYPSSWTGQASVDSYPYILDLMGIGELARLGGAGVKALKNYGTQRALAKEADNMFSLHMEQALAEQGLDPVDIAELRKMNIPEDEMAMFIKSGDPAAQAAKEASDPAIKALKERQNISKVQNQADRALREASREESQAILNLQGKVDDLLRQGIVDEQQAQRLLEEQVDRIMMQTRLDDMVLGPTERLEQMMGPTMRELYEADPAIFDAVWFKELIEPVTSSKIRGLDGGLQPNFRLNYNGGRIPMKAIKSNG